MTNRVERGHGTGSRAGFRGRWDVEHVANIEEYFEQQLFALISGIQIGHAAFILGGLRALVGLSIDRIEIIQNLLAGPWTHSGERYRFRP